MAVFSIITTKHEKEKTDYKIWNAYSFQFMHWLVEWSCDYINSRMISQCFKLFWCKNVFDIFINFGSGYGLLPDSTKPWPQAAFMNGQAIHLNCENQMPLLVTMLMLWILCLKWQAISEWIVILLTSLIRINGWFDSKCPQLPGFIMAVLWCQTEIWYWWMSNYFFNYA